jgi:hypothetical protein
LLVFWYWFQRWYSGICSTETNIPTLGKRKYMPVSDLKALAYRGTGLDCIHQIYAQAVHVNDEIYLKHVKVEFLFKFVQVTCFVLDSALATCTSGQFQRKVPKQGRDKMITRAPGEMRRS